MSNPNFEKHRKPVLPQVVGELGCRPGSRLCAEHQPQQGWRENEPSILQRLAFSTVALHRDAPSQTESLLISPDAGEQPAGCFCAESVEIAQRMTRQLRTQHAQGSRSLCSSNRALLSKWSIPPSACLAKACLCLSPSLCPGCALTWYHLIREIGLLASSSGNDAAHSLALQAPCDPLYSREMFIIEV